MLPRGIALFGFKDFKSIDYFLNTWGYQSFVTNANIFSFHYIRYRLNVIILDKGITIFFQVSKFVNFYFISFIVF